jgi:hypothetical protein
MSSWQGNQGVHNSSGIFYKAHYGDGNLEKPHVGDGKKKIPTVLLPRVTVQTAAGTAARMSGPQQVLVIKVSEGDRMLKAQNASLLLCPNMKWQRK